MPILDSGKENRILLLLKQEDAAGLKLELKQLFQMLEQDPKPQLWVEKLMKHLVTISQHAILSNGASSSLNLDLATDEAISNSSNYNELMQNMWFIFEDLMWRRKHRTEEKVKPSELLLRLDEFLQEHLHENLNNTLLSKKFGFAPSYLSKLFRNYKGMSPSEYLINLRVEKAKQLMKSEPDISSKEISIILGYSDPLYYSKIFKKVTGVWPSDYKTIISGS
jgi:YesN/AraC family two-component response regulator